MRERETDRADCNVGLTPVKGEAKGRGLRRSLRAYGSKGVLASPWGSLGVAIAL